MSALTRRKFFAFALLGGIGGLLRIARTSEGELPPTLADPAVPEGSVVWVEGPNGGTTRRICRRGYWVTA